MDDAEPEGNGIVCSGGMAANDPLCTEQFTHSAIASLKVVPEPGYVFTGWTLNGGQVKLTTAAPLFLTTMPVFAQTGDFVTPFTGNTADCQANCSNVTITVPASVQRDEIFGVTLTLDPPPLLSWEGLRLSFDLIGQKTQELPGRGEVQMYDFGYDIDGDGDIDPNQTSYIFNPLLDSGTKTIKAVYNLYQPPQTIRVLATVGGNTFESQPIAVTYQIRKYTTEQGYIHTNDFDEHTNPLKRIQHWVDYWDDWNYPENSEPYTFKMNGGEIEDKLEYDLAKAVCFKESHMASVDLMQMTSVALQSLSGTLTERDWNWNVLPDVDGDYPLSGQVELHYTGVSDTTEEGSLKWGVRWLYAKKSRALNGSKPGTFRPVWDNWTTTLENYNGEDEKVQYAIDVLTLYQSGKNPHAGNPEYMWPIMTNGNARQ